MVLRVVRDGEPPGPPGRYELRPLTRSGVDLVQVVWLGAGERVPIVAMEVVPDRLPLLAEALNEHLAGDTPRSNTRTT